MTGADRRPVDDHERHPEGQLEETVEELVEEVVERAVPTGRMAQAGAAQFSLSEAIGGVRGLLESVVPFAVFSGAYAVTEELRPSIIAALVPAVVLSLWRIVAREPLTQAVSGVIGIGIGAFIASRTGNATDVFVPSLLKNVGQRARLRDLGARPLAGRRARRRPGHRRDARLALRPGRGSRPTGSRPGSGSAMFLVRLAVQFPLYLADQTVLLGTLNAFVLGLPLFGLAVWLSWVILRRVPPARPGPDSARTSRPATSAPVLRGEDLLEGLLALRHGDEDQLVVSLERVVPAGRDRPLAADDADQHGVVRPA